MYVNDIISNFDVAWKKGDKVVLAMPPGYGKTQFILGTYLDYIREIGGEVLYILNRELLESQVFVEVCRREEIDPKYFEGQTFIELPSITFTTYQAIEIMLGEGTDIPYFHTVVFDEVAYYASDSEFNPRMIRSLNWLHKLKTSIQIYISGTISAVIEYIIPDIKDWVCIHQDFYFDIFESKRPSIMTAVNGQKPRLYWFDMPEKRQKYSVFIYDSNEDIVEAINQDETDKKWLVFQSNKQKAIDELASKIDKSCELITADNKYGRVMNKLVNEKQFDSKVLIATKVMDVGVSIHDEKVTHVVMNTNNRYEFKQMLGRRRINEGENVTLEIFLPRRSKGYFQTQRIRSIEPAINFLEKTSVEILKDIKESRQAYDYFLKYCDVKKGKIIKNYIAKNELEKKRKLFCKYEEGLTTDLNFFAKVQMEWLGTENIVEVVDLAEDKKKVLKNALVECLKNMLGKELCKEEQEQFRENIKPLLQYILPKEFPQTKRTPGLTIINRCLDTLKLGMKVTSIASKKKGEESRWLITKVKPL